MRNFNIPLRTTHTLPRRHYIRIIVTFCIIWKLLESNTSNLWDSFWFWIKLVVRLVCFFYQTFYQLPLVMELVLRNDEHYDSGHVARVW